MPPTTHFPATHTAAAPRGLASMYPDPPSSSSAPLGGTQQYTDELRGRCFRSLSPATAATAHGGLLLQPRAASSRYSPGLQHAPLSPSNSAVGEYRSRRHGGGESPYGVGGGDGGGGAMAEGL